jgi:hypothetical protein
MQFDKLDFVDGFSKQANSEGIKKKRDGKPTFHHYSIGRVCHGSLKREIYFSVDSK